MTATQENLSVDQRAQNLVASEVCEYLTASFDEHKRPNGTAYIDQLPVGLFLRISDYTSNRNASLRAAKAGKKEVSHMKGAISVNQQKLVKVCKITREAAPVAWERTYQDSLARNVPCTLPFVLEDGHTRKQAMLTPIGGGNYQLERPEFIEVLIYSLNPKGEPITDDDFFRMVEAECSTETAATSAERGEMAIREANLGTLRSGFCLKNWLNPVRFWNRKAKLVDILKRYSTGFRALDDFGLPSTAPRKTNEVESPNEYKARFRSGAKAAIIYSFSIAEDYNLNPEQVVNGFWKQYYSPWIEGEAAPTEGAVFELIRWTQEISIYNTSFDNNFYDVAKNKIVAWCSAQAVSAG